MAFFLQPGACGTVALYHSWLGFSFVHSFIHSSSCVEGLGWVRVADVRCRRQERFQELFSPSTVWTRGLNSVVRLGGEHLLPLGHLTSPPLPLILGSGLRLTIAKYNPNFAGLIGVSYHTQSVQSCGVLWGEWWWWGFTGDVWDAGLGACWASIVPSDPPASELLGSSVVEYRELPASATRPNLEKE